MKPTCLSLRLPFPYWLVSFRPRTPSNVQPTSFAPAVPVPMGPLSPDHEGQRLPERTECA
jgi:hypothetical protein